MPAMDARARDLDNGRKKLEEFRARKAARKHAVKQPATKDDGVDADARERQGTVLDEDATYTARLEAKLAALSERGNTVGSVGTAADEKIGDGMHRDDEASVDD